MFTFEDLQTAAGAAAAAGLVMVLVQLIKAVLPGLFNRLTGALWAFLGTAIIYVIGAVVLAPGWAGPNDGLAYFLSWVTCATAALGIHVAANAGTTTFVKSTPKPPDQ